MYDPSSGEDGRIGLNGDPDHENNSGPLFNGRGVGNLTKVSH